MKKMKKLNRKKINPQSPVFTGVKYVDDISSQLFKYDEYSYVETKEFSIKNFRNFEISNNNYWLNLHGIHDVEKVSYLCKNLGIHNLLIQDILDVNQRPKVEDYGDYCFFSTKSILPSFNNEIESEQLSFILGKNYLLSFQEKKGDHFDHVRQRIREKLGLVRYRRPDFLLFLLFESILDNYFKTIDILESKLDENRIIDIKSDPSPDIIQNIENLKRQVLLIKKTIIPIKEFMVKIEHEDFDLISEKNLKYFSELKDLCLTLLDNCDKLEIRIESSVNMFFSIQGHRMNQVMKTLTVVATIFIPLTFIAGIYGMNFSNMPELQWKWGYFGVWLIMISVAVGMLIYFRNKKWF